MSEITFLSATSMAEQIRARKLSSFELVEAHLARIEKLNPKLTAFAQLDSDGARRGAQSAILSRGRCHAARTDDEGPGSRPEPNPHRIFHLGSC
jgi:Asp-tRNA(Asn)/Glu-tRNA(Gln) amidotransferase A subunit family amidase